MTLQLIAEAESAGARLAVASGALGVSARTVERWRAGAEEDLRRGPNTPPANKLTPEERCEVLTTVNEPRFRNRSPNEIVPMLADEGRYLASESTVYRVLREENQLKHRGRSKPPERRTTAPHVATGPNQVWSWDITYLRSAKRGDFFYLYLVLDVWSRKVVAWEVHEAESSELAAAMIERACKASAINPAGLVLHSDNGGPMKGTTMLAMLEWLGIAASFSRPGVSDDNAFVEAIFRTLKYRPEYPSRPFDDLLSTRAWVEAFVAWYNTGHLHSGICFVTPHDRHEGRDAAVLANRHRVYQQARASRPERWSRGTRRWQAIAEVRLNPGRPTYSSNKLSGSQRKQLDHKLAPRNPGGLQPPYPLSLASGQPSAEA